MRHEADVLECQPPVRPRDPETAAGALRREWPVQGGAVLKKKTPRKKRPLTLRQRYTRVLPTLSDEAFLKITNVYERLAKERPYSSVPELFFMASAEVGKGTETDG